MKDFNLSAGLGQFVDDNKDLVIIDELKNFIPALTDDETQLLEQSILKDGIKEPIDIWDKDGESVVIDGHNRYRIAKEHNVHFKTKLHNFNSIDEVKDWMLHKQLGRRNLTDKARTYFIGLLYNKAKNKKGGDMSKGQNLPLERTDEKIASEIGVSPRTVRNAGDFATGLDSLPTEEKNDILAGKKKVSKAEVQQKAKPKKEKLKKEPVQIDYKKKVLNLLSHLPNEEVINILNDCINDLY